MTTHSAPAAGLPRRTRALLALALTSTLAAGVAEVLAVAATGALVGELATHGAPGLAATRLARAGLAWALLTAAAVVAGRTCGYGMSAVLHESIASHLLRLPLAWFGAGRAGEVSFLLGPQVMQVMSIPAHLLFPALRAVVVPVGLIVVIAGHSPAAAVVATCWLPVLALTQWWSARRAAAGDAALAAARSASSARVLEYVEGQRTLRLVPNPDHATRQVKAAITEVSRSMDAQVFPVVRVMGLFTLAIQLMLVTVTATGLAGSAHTDPGSTAAFLLAVVSLTAVLHGAAGLSATIRSAFSAATAIRTFLANPPMAEPSTPAEAPRTGTIDITGLTLGPDEDTCILHDVDLHADPGSFTALVGSSGAGKTTLLRALARFADPLHGSVRIDGVDARDLGSAGVHERVAMVFQDVELFDGTLRDNILMGRPDATEADLERAVHRAGMTEMLQRLPAGLDTPVGEHGTGLSGGERQRVSIARALVKDAPVLLLDEPAAALDGESRRRIEATFEALRGQVTIVLVTHNLTSARHADRIVVLDGGRVVETGTHTTLLATGGEYARLWIATTSGT